MRSPSTPQTTSQAATPNLSHTEAPATAKIATVFGFIWAGLVIASGMVANIGASLIVETYSQYPEQATSLWLTMHFVVDGLGSGNEIVGGLWICLISWAALSSRKLSKALSYFGIVVGAMGVVTVIPALGELGAAFGLGSIVWFLWLGKALLLQKPLENPVTTRAISF